MKVTNTDIFMRNKDIASVFGVMIAILIVPLIAMQFTNEVQWNFFDFIVMSVLLTGTGLLLVLTARMIKNTNYKIVVAIALLIVLFLTWAELSVGIFGSTLAGS